MLYDIRALPESPAIYAMYGGEGRRYVAYVGLGESLRRRIEQHLIKRDSSVTTGAQAVGLHPEHVREVAWWDHPDFADPDVLHAAELVAFDVLEPALRSRARIRQKAQALYDDATFRRKLAKLFVEAPAGRLLIPTLSELSSRLRELEAVVGELQSRQGREQPRH
jgi:hypothetical protein